MASQDAFDARLVVRQPGRDDIETIISDPLEWEVTYVHGRLGENALKVSVDASSPNVKWMLNECDVSVEVNTLTTGKWTEPHNSRFINLGWGRDKTARTGSPVEGQFMPYSWLLSKAVLVPVQPFLPIDQRDTRRFRNRNPGQVVNAIVHESQNRGWLEKIQSWATGFNDATGKPWPQQNVNIDFAVGSTVLDAINQLISEGLVEVRMNGRNLLLWRRGFFPYETNTILRTGEDILRYDEKGDRSQRATHALLIGDSSTYYLDAESPSLKRTSWGPWGATIQTGGTKRAAMLKTGKNKLDALSKVRVSNDTDLVFKPDSPFPFRNYEPGSYVTINPSDGPAERVRIAQMVIGRSRNGLLSGKLTFGERRLATTTRLVSAVKTVAPTGVAAAGNGTQATLVKPRPNRYDVVALGADANGVDPDDAAVAEIMTEMAVPGDSFFVRVGSNLTLNTQLLFNTTVRVEGGGTITQRTPGQAGIVIGPSAHGSIIRDVTLNGTGYATLATGSYAIKLQGTSPAARTRDVLIDNVAINNWQQYGIYADLTDNLEVTGCEIAGIHYAGIGLLSPRGFKIHWNKISTIQGLASNNNGYGIFASRLSSFSEADRPQAQDGMINFNVIDGVPTWEGIDTHAGTNIDVIGNRIFNTRVGIAIVSGVNQSGVAAFGAKNVKVLDNTIDAQVADGTRGPGVIIQGAGVTVGEFVDGATALVSGNIIRNHGLHAANINGGIQFYWTINTTALNNILYQCSPAGIAVFHTNHGYKVLGNTAEAVWSNGFAQPSMIMVPSNFNTGAIGDNRITEGTKAAAYRNVYGFNSLPVNTTNVVYEVSSNDFRQSTQQWRDLSGQGENRFNAHKVGFRGAAPISIPAVVGSRGGNAALASLLTALHNQGIITNSTST